MTECVSATTPGNKQKKAGLQVNSCFNFNTSTGHLEMELQFTNQSGDAISGFDLMINKNSFGVGTDGSCQSLGITFPAPFETSPVQIVPLKIDKKNADVKNPPKHPFTLQIALKSSLDIFYFNVPCLLHCLINRDAKMTKDEFGKFWGMITAEKTYEIEYSRSDLYKGFTNLPGDVVQCLENNGFVQFQETAQMCFGAKTVNNLPLLFSVEHPHNGDGLKVTYKIPVMPLKPLLVDAINHIFTRK